jgi:hypothetical protein
MSWTLWSGTKSLQIGPRQWRNLSNEGVPCGLDRACSDWRLLAGALDIEERGLAGLDRRTVRLVVPDRGTRLATYRRAWTRWSGSRNSQIGGLSQGCQYTKLRGLAGVEQQL